MHNWKETLVVMPFSIEFVMRKMNESGTPILLVVDKDEILLGVVTDGDIRRGLLRNLTLKDDVSNIMNKSPLTGKTDTKKNVYRDLFEKNKIRYIPIVDSARKVIGVKSYQESVGRETFDNIVFIMAGGLGSRLSPLTDELPKPLLNVGAKPILQNILESFVEYGFHNFYFSVNYKSEMIKDYFGDGSNWGVSIQYIEETKRLGTAGPLSLLNEETNVPLIVMNGDLLTKVDFTMLLDFHNSSEASATMCVREYSYQVPYGVVKAKEHRMVGIDEKPTHNFFINAGIYALSPEVLPLIPKETSYKMTDLMEKIKDKKGGVSVFPIYEYWLDIGKMDDFERAQRDVHLHFSGDPK